ncbi:MAG TPA: L,D-transpeptidase [Gaiellaceae bacterium]|nr:L,D-transpeptidase [Gaiellaceae bacterium]
MVSRPAADPPERRDRLRARVRARATDRRRADRRRSLAAAADALPLRQAGAIGISAFSDVLTGWAQGGPVAIHGTDEPWSIGRPVSNGCIRLPNATLERLWPLAVAGTPVIIRD